MTMTNIFQVYEYVKKIASTRKIYIRGAGYQGRKLFYQLKQLGINVAAFIDKSDINDFTDDFNVPVLKPADIYAGEEKPFIICSMADDDSYFTVRQEMELHGMKEGADFADFFIKSRMHFPEPNFHYKSNQYNDLKIKIEKHYADTVQQLNEHLGGSYYFENKNITKKENVLSLLDFIITEFCTLQCKYCSHAIPLCKKPKHFEPELIVGDLDKFLGSCKVLVVGIMGGEPLLYPQLPKLLQLLSSLKNIDNAGCFRIVTNGTLDVSDDILREIKAFPKPFYIYNSNYAAQSVKSKHISEKCAINGVICYVQDYGYSWIDLGNPTYTRNYTEEKLKSIYTLCPMSLCCNQLHDGKFYSCGRIPMLLENGYLPQDAKLYADIRNTPSNLLESKINGFLYKTDMLSACQYCDGFFEYSPKISKGI